MVDILSVRRFLMKHGLYNLVKTMIVQQCPYSCVYYYEVAETILQDFLEILKLRLQNFKKVL